MLNIPSLYKINSDVISFTSSEQLLEIYLSYRAIGKTLLVELLKYKPKEAIQACGKKLGIVKCDKCDHTTKPD